MPKKANTNKLNIIEKIVNWKAISILAIIFLFFTLYLFPTYQAEINNISNYDVLLLDGRFSYTKIEVLKIFEIMGGEGRKIYRLIAGFIDMIYPIVYGLLFSLLLIKTANNNSKLKLAYIIPLIAVLFDYIENIGILTMLNNYPTLSSSEVNSYALATSLKWVFIFLTLLLIFILSVSKFFSKKG